MDVEFRDLSFTLPGSLWNSRVPGKAILKSVSGRFRPGQLSAILGPSGAGKSSLLNALSGYRSTGVTGELLTNGQPRDERLFRKCSCYITQDDLLQPFLTLKELMTFAAKLKLPSAISAKERRGIVSQIINKIGLSSSQDTFTDKLSGGQKKRLSIALELINNPPVFFLDEPTSGLDNVSAKQCLRILKTLTQQNRTIVCTIHQPSATLFEMFDLIYVVSQGVCVYQGTPMGLLPFLASVGLNCPLSYSPADYVIEISDGEEVHNVQFLANAIRNGKVVWDEFNGKIISDRVTTLPVPCATIIEATEEKEAFNVQFLTNAIHSGKVVWKETSDEITITGLMTRLLLPVTKDIKGVSLKLQEIKFQTLEQQMSRVGFATSGWSQFITLFSRMMLQIGRNRTPLWIQLFHHILCSTLLGIVFYNTAQDADQWYINLKIIIAIIVFHTYTWTMVPVLSYPNEVKLLQREHFNRWYGFSPYYIALTLSTIPAKIFFSLIFLTNIYYLIGLPFEVFRFSLFCMIGILISNVTEGMGYAIGSTFSVTNGAAVGPAVIAPFMGLAMYGYDFAKQISTVMKLIMRTSFMRCGIVAMAITVFGLDRPALGCSDKFGYCHFRDPNTLMEMWDFNKTSIWVELLLLISMLLVFRLIFFVLLRKRLKT